MNHKPGYHADLLYFAAVRMKPFAFHAHDLSTAYAALAAANVRGSHLIVDFHEWFSENVHWDSTNLRWAPYPDDWKRDLQKLETRCLSEASATITVCDSIADGMVNELGGQRPHVIRNIPNLTMVPTREYPPLKKQLELAESYFIVLWQGGTGPTRMIEPIIESLAFAPRCVFVVRGPSLHIFGDDYRALARRLGVEDRLVLTGPVPSGDVVAAARGADAGIWTLPALCRNFTYALPNKIFEYITSGLPVLAAHYPEAKRLLADHDVGLTFDPYDPRSIAAAINQLIDDPGLAERFRTNTSAALLRLDADAEWQKLVTVYDDLPRTG
jgi:glycosyltransferase involved in cell wall biosynthesis